MRDEILSDACSLATVDDVMHRALGVGRVADLAAHHLDSGGSRTRASLGLDTARHLGLATDVAVALAAASELLHNAALIHDDIQDKDTERRGAPALWVKGGVGPAICAGDLMISAATHVLAVGMPLAQLRTALAMMHTAVAETIAGQDADLTAAAHLSFKDTVAIAAGKSGPLIALPVRLALMAARAEGDGAADTAARALAVGYQVLDDLRDLAEDRRAGRPNVVLALENMGRSRQHAVEYARTQLHAADATARSIPHDAGLPMASLSARIQSQLMEIADAT